MRDLAHMIADKTGCGINFMSNPRNEASENELEVKNEKFGNLGVDFKSLDKTLLEEVNMTVPIYVLAFFRRQKENGWPLLPMPELLIFLSRPRVFSFIVRRSRIVECENSRCNIVRLFYSRWNFWIFVKVVRAPSIQCTYVAPIGGALFLTRGPEDLVKTNDSSSTGGSHFPCSCCKLLP